jgi:hypothetical protein
LVADEQKRKAAEIVAEHVPDAPDAPKKSVATRLVELVTARYELGCTPVGEPYAIPHDGPRVVRLLRGGRGSLRAELARAYYEQTGSVASQSALADACMVIEGMAQQIDPVELHLRVAQHDGCLVLDLGDPTGRAVVITPTGWTIALSPPVRFRRTAATGPLPVPERGAELSLLWDEVNIAERYRPVVAAVLVAELMPDLSHPVVRITGEHGTGKTTAMSRLASIVDPSPVPVRKAPREVEAWTTAAAGSWVVALDNLSGMPDWLSDALCRASTGDGDLRRKLYTDGDLYVVAFRRAPMINGIDLGDLRGDLADRLVDLGLERISDDQRRSEEEMAAQWRQAHPRVLGALLDLTVRVLAALPEIRLAQLPRMADYARVLAAVDHVFGTEGLTTYLGLREELATDVITSDPVLIAITDAIMEPFAGTSAQLLAAITPATNKWRPPKGWPASARALTAVLHRQAPTLRRLGWKIEELVKDSRARALRFQLNPPLDSNGQRRVGNDARNTRDGHVPTDQGAAVGASDVWGTSEAASTDAHTAPEPASTDPRTVTPLASTNEATSSNTSVASDKNTSSLSTTCRECSKTSRFALVNGQCRPCRFAGRAAS